MMPQQRNQMTMDILKRLREKGMPERSKPIPLMGEEEPQAADLGAEGEVPQPEKKEDDETPEEIPSPDGVVTDNSLPGSPLMNRMKRLQRRR